VEARTADELVEAVAAADAADEGLLVMAGGSNLVIADAGFEGTVVRVLTRGISADTRGDRAGLFVAAGEPWDELVARCVAEGLAGIECLSGIPGSTGATPIQNVGAYRTGGRRQDRLGARLRPRGADRRRARAHGVQVCLSL
jgi:UDP-N-acetylmuramate dehydrogenase